MNPYSSHISSNLSQGFVDLELPVSSRGLVDGPSVSLRAEGIHLPEDGSLMALVEPKELVFV